MLLHQLGEGAAGIVYAAYDIELKRKVALKLMRRDLPGHSAAERARFVAEARAIARLSHPNAVEVFDVLVVVDEVVIAMELVDGPTLAGWLRAGVRHWAEIVGALVQAGRGLAAAHAVGLVHRDFKPTNVLVGNDGRVRVVDFGVAHPLDAASTRDEIVGTSGYIAPEQARGDVGPAADQFSFCVTAYVALYGGLPFEGASVDARIEAAAASRFEALPDDRDVPPWIHAAVIRGLHADPRRRFADMPALLHALEHTPRPRRYVLAAVVGGGIVALATALLLLAPADTACAHAAERVATAWSDEHETRIRDAFAATSSASARDAADRVVDRLDRHAQAWTHAYTEACEAARVRGDASLDARVACLTRRLAEVEAVVSVLESADAAVVDRAVAAAADLRDASECLQEGSDDAPPPELAERVATVRGHLANVQALSAAGRYREGLDLAEAALADAIAIDYAPLLAEAQFWRGALRVHLGDFDDALEDFSAAMYTAEAAGADAIALRIAARRTELLGDDLSRTEDALAEGRRATAIVERIGNPPEEHAVIENAIGIVLHAAGRNDEALPRFERALALRMEVLDPDDPKVAQTLNNIAIVLQESGDFRRAAEAHERALQANIAAFGPRHRAVGRSLNNLGNALHSLGEYERALAAFDRAIEVCTPALGEDHPDVAAAHINRGNALDGLGRIAEARAAWEHALAIFERRGDADNPAAGAILNNLGRAALDAGDHDEAIRSFARAIEMWEASIGPDHVNLGYPLTNMAVIRNDRGEHEAARALLERALTLREHGAVHPIELARTRFELARALGPDGAQRERALELAEDARATFAELDAKSDVAEVDAWLSAMRNDPPP